MDDEKDNFEKIINKINKLQGNSEIRFKDLFNMKFMKKYTDFNSINHMFQESGFEIRSGEEFDNIPEKDLNNFVDETTDFSDWDEMIERAITNWIKIQR